MYDMAIIFKDLSDADLYIPKVKHTEEHTDTSLKQILFVWTSEGDKYRIDYESVLYTKKINYFTEEKIK